MPETSLSYRALVRAAVTVVPLLALVDSKVRAGHRGRRGAEGHLSEWARRGRDPARPLAWFHASSVGEGLQAGSVIDELRRLQPDCQFVFTHFSPSAEPLAKRLSVDASGYAPYDLPGPTGALLDALRPDLVVFSKLDLWPELATQAAARGVPVAIVAGTVSPGSSRLRWPARSLLAPGYGSVVAAGVIAEPDASRLALLGVDRSAIHVLGDPRFDSVMQRVRATGADDALLRFGRGAPTLIAGSTWPADESLLIEAFAGLSATRPDARLIVVPHEPTPTHLAALDRLAARASLERPVRLSEATGPVRLMVVDRVGVLATLYGAGSMAYVGGGFGRAGLHSVLEPAAWALPVAFGPRWQESRDAELLIEGRAAIAIETAVALRRIWKVWLTDESNRVAQGRRAREVVEGGLGAARRSAELLGRLISSRHPRTSPSAAR
ncbi:MAG TPA: glycosyltransferase N-terminal domain-containing protein [Gemmatimonadales bacterium]